MINSLLLKFNRKLENVHIKELFSGSVVAFTIKLLGVAAGYVFFYLVSRKYGARGMGIYSLSMAVLMILRMFGTLGFSSSLLRYVGQYSAEKNKYKIKMLYKSMLKISVPFSVFISLLLYFFSQNIAVSLFHDENLVGALKIISVIVPLFAINAINVQLIRGLKNIPLSEYLRNLNRPVLCILFLFIVSFFKVDHYVPVIALSLAIIVTFILSISYVIKRISKFTEKGDEALSKKDIFNTSLPMMVDFKKTHNKQE